MLSRDDHGCTETFERSGDDGSIAQVEEFEEPSFETDPLASSGRRSYAFQWGCRSDLAMLASQIIGSIDRLEQITSRLQDLPTGTP